MSGPERRGDETLELFDERMASLQLKVECLDAIISSLILLQRSRAEGLNINRVVAPLFEVRIWTAR